MYTLIHSYVPLHSSLYPQTDGNVLVYIYIYIHIYIHTHTYIYIYIHICVCVCAHISVCVYVYIYINIRIIRAYIFSGGKRLLRYMRIHSHIDPSTGIMCTFI